MSESSPSTTELPRVADLLARDTAAARVFPLDGELKAHVIASPGTALNISTHRRIYDALVHVTTRSFMADMTPYWEIRSREGYLERLSEFVLVADGTGAMVGWTGYHRLQHDEHTIVYIDSTGMVKERQSRGAMRKLMAGLITESALPGCPDGLPVHLAARSESPVFYRLMRHLVAGNDQLFPHPSLPVPDDVRLCAADLAVWLGQRPLLEESSLALRGAYDSLDELYDELPTTGDPDLDTLFRDRLGPLDAYLVVGRVR